MATIRKSLKARRSATRRALGWASSERQAFAYRGTSRNGRNGALIDWSLSTRFRAFANGPGTPNTVPNPYGRNIGLAPILVR